MHMPILNAHEMNTRHNEFLRQIREATRLFRFGPAAALAAEQAAQRQYAAWFQERGIMLIFPEEEEGTGAKRGE